MRVSTCTSCHLWLSLPEFVTAHYLANGPNVCVIHDDLRYHNASSEHNVLRDPSNLFSRFTSESLNVIAACRARSASLLPARTHTSVSTSESTSNISTQVWLSKGHEPAQAHWHESLKSMLIYSTGTGWEPLTSVEHVKGRVHAITTWLYVAQHSCFHLQRE